MMIVALEGILESGGTESLIVKVGSFSLKIYVPVSTLDKVGTVGSKVHLYTHLYFREDNIAMYGFASAEELRLFQDLTSVSGIGPRAALGMLSTLTVEQLVSAISGNNVDLLSQVPGIGKKMAGRIALELKGKLERDWGGVIAPALVQEDADLVAVLTGLGYSLKEATQAASALHASQGLDLEEKVRLALQKLAVV